MCRNIRVLYNFEPPTTREEIRAAAFQYVRKVSGLAKPPAADVAAFETAVDEIAKSTGRLLHSLSARTAVRTRESERSKAHARWEKREKELRDWLDKARSRAAIRALPGLTSPSGAGPTRRSRRDSSLSR